MTQPSVLKVSQIARRLLHSSFTDIAYRYEHLTPKEREAVGSETDWALLMAWLGGPLYAKYGWMVTVDSTQMSGEACVRGIVGPGRIDPLVSERLFCQPTNCARWRMRDDDGELYYEGLIYGEYTGFEPLDDYGRPNAGCTTIEYWSAVAKKWAAL